MSGVGYGQGLTGLTVSNDMLNDISNAIASNDMLNAMQSPAMSLGMALAARPGVVSGLSIYNNDNQWRTNLTGGQLMDGYSGVSGSSTRKFEESYTEYYQRMTGLFHSRITPETKIMIDGTKHFVITTHGGVIGSGTADECMTIAKRYASQNDGEAFICKPVSAVRPKKDLEIETL